MKAFTTLSLASFITLAVAQLGIEENVRICIRNCGGSSNFACIGQCISGYGQNVPDSQLGGIIQGIQSSDQSNGQAGSQTTSAGTAIVVPASTVNPQSPTPSSSMSSMSSVSSLNSAASSSISSVQSQASSASSSVKSSVSSRVSSINSTNASSDATFISGSIIFLTAPLIVSFIN